MVRKEQHIGLSGSKGIKEERFEGSALLSTVLAANSQSTSLQKLLQTVRNPVYEVILQEGNMPLLKTGCSHGVKKGNVTNPSKTG